MSDEILPRDCRPMKVDPYAFHQYEVDRRSGRVSARVMPISQAVQTGVAVIDVRGVMVRDAAWSDEVSTSQLEAILDGAAESESITAVVLNFDSPGGSVSGLASLVASASRLASKKPLFAFVDDFCCSAAYELAVSAEKIYARQRATIGSIGTRILMYDWSKLFEKEGVEAVAIDTGEFKSLGAIGLKITDTHREYLQQLVDQAQEDFAVAVKTGRRFSDEQYAEVADGKIWWAEEALGMGLIDGVQTLAETISAAANAATAKFSSQTHRSRQMAEQTPTAPAAPQAATLKELQANLPGASSEFVLEQLAAEATLQQAMTAHMKQLAEANAAAIEAKATAEAEAIEAKSKADKAAAQSPTPEPKRKGNPGVTSAGSQSESETPIDFRQMALDDAKARKISFAQACLRLKKLYPEARAFFGAPPAA